MNEPAPGVAGSYPAAELDRRFYAFAIDRFIAWGIFAVAAFLAWRFLFDVNKTGAGIAVIVGTVVLVSLIYAVLLGVAGLSPGKALVGLRVVGYSDGRPIGVPKALVRTAVLGMFTLPTAGLGLTTLAWTAVMDPGGRRRGGHDRMSDAVVVDVRPVPELESDADDRPRQVVNLTAMRLMPAGAAQVRSVARPLVAPGAPPSASTPPPRTPPASPPASPPISAPFSPPISQPVQIPQTAPTSRPPPAPPVAPASEGSPSSASLSAPLPATPADRRTPGPPSSAPPAARPGTWSVHFDTGETFVVEGLALVGRRPEPRAGEPVKHLVPLRSSDMSLSKTHAQFQVVPDGALVVMDRGSTNGSVIVRQGVSKPLTAGRPATLLDGDTVRFGDRSMTVTKETNL